MQDNHDEAKQQSTRSMPAPGSVVGGGRYALRRILGEGGHGIVWLATDLGTDDPVALKFLFPGRAPGEHRLGALRYATSQLQALRHENIGRVIALQETPGEEPFVVMEFVAGRTLASLKVEEPPGSIAWSRLRPMALQIAAALACAHARGIVHRDLKPTNVLVDLSGRVKVVDFGIAFESARHRTFSGTFCYMSPQQINGESPAPADDVYAFAATLFEMLTGTPPFTQDVVYQHLHAEAPRLSRILAERGLPNTVPAAVEDVIARALAKRAEDRPRDVQAMSAVFAKHASSRKAFPRRQLIASAAGAFVLCASIAVVLNPPEGPTDAAVPCNELLFEEHFENITADRAPVGWEHPNVPPALSKDFDFAVRSDGTNRFFRVVSRNEDAIVNCGRMLRVPAAPACREMAVSVRMRARDIALGPKQWSGAKLGLIWFDHQWQQIAIPPRPTLQTSNDWTLLKVTIPTPTNAAYLRVEPGFYLARGTCDFDDIEVRVTKRANEMPRH